MTLSMDGTAHINLIKDFLEEAAEKRRYKMLKPKNWVGFCAKNVPLRTKAYDCGVFTCQFNECVSRNGSANFSQKQMEDIRKQMAEEIYGKLRYE
uniref:Ubiquitin-like protease family profile domain-containing protein n=1 Tax=Ditylenchus dipsaci TaxID=166011 RepID=A0A915E695_9BILA